MAMEIWKSGSGNRRIWNMERLFSFFAKKGKKSEKIELRQSSVTHVFQKNDYI